MNPSIRSIDDLEGWRHLSLGKVGSTNVEAMRLANEGDPGKLWVTASEQTAGKARRGRSWISQNGNLYSSLLLIDPAPRETLGSLPLVASVALHRTLCELFPKIDSRLSIKWPNDLLLNGQKLSGLLLEASTDTAGRLIVVIGCGVNCCHYPDNPLYPATSLQEAGFDMPPLAVFACFAQQMADMLEIWDQGRGLGDIRNDWLARAKGLGSVITARFEDHEITGLFKGMDEIGRLVLVERNGTEHFISAADIFFGNSNPFRA